MTAEDKFNLEILLGIAAGLWTLGFLIRWIESIPRKWPQSSGVIVASSIIRGKAAIPIIEYQFDYLGKTYKSSHWRWGNFSTGYGISADAVMARYRVGSPVTVFVNAKDPTKSVLEAKPSSLCWAPFGFGIFLVAVVLLFVLVRFQKG